MFGFSELLAADTLTDSIVESANAMNLLVFLR
jgi:hypothetical protein